jgi:hypothetical protein
MTQDEAKMTPLQIQNSGKCLYILKIIQKHMLGAKEMGIQWN